MYIRPLYSRSTYYYLFSTIVASVCGAFLGFQNPPILIWLSSWFGWIVALIIINTIPRIVMNYRHKLIVGFLLLVIKGGFYGLILSPVILISEKLKSKIGFTEIALIISAVIFIFITALVKSTGRHYQVSQKLMRMISISLIGAVILNLIMPVGILGLLISIGIGIFGILILVYATAGIINYQGTDSPILGALILFSALFDIFTAVIYLTIMFHPIFESL